MDGQRLSRKLLLLVGCGVLLAQGCGSPINSNKTKAPPIVRPGGSVNPDVGESPSDAAGMFIGLTSDKLDTITVHRADVQYSSLVGSVNERIDAGVTNFSTECRIPLDTASPDNDILCIAELEELDLYFNKFTMQYHVPPSQCDYATFFPYWFYAYEPGDGPSVVSYEVDASGTIINEVNSVNGVPQCDYDYTDSEGNGVNCCMGEFTLTVTTDGVVAPPSTQEWGGEMSACMWGPAATASWTHKTDANVPIPEVQLVEGTGINSTFSILDTINQSLGGNQNLSNVFAANFYNPSDHTGSTGRLLSTAYDPDRPPAMKFPQNATDASAANPELFPNDTYVLTCLDRSEEVLARIRFMIRDWNTSPITETTGDPDFGGVLNPQPPPADFPDEVWDDRWDWQDFGNLYPASSL